MRRISFALVLTLSLAIGVVATLHAQETPTREYVGVTTDLADFKLIVTGGITGIEIGAPTASVPFPCYGGAGTITLTDPIEILKDTISGGTGERQITDASGQARILRISGQIPSTGREYGIATGDLSISAVGPDGEGVVCNPRSFGWVAATRTSDGAPVAGATYRGPVLSGQGMGGLTEGGTASLEVTADAASVTKIALTTAQECTSMNLDATAPLANGVASFTEEGRVSTAIPTVAKLRVSVAGDRALGAFFIDRGTPGCRAMGGYFTATAVKPATATPAPAATPSGTPAPTPTAGTTATITSGAIPLSGGIGLVVWGGGSGDQLLTASKCPRTSAAFWVANAGGGFDTYVPGAAIEVVNATWNARFPGGVIPAGTPLLGRCA